MEGYEGEVEKTRGFVYEANMALDKLRKEDWTGTTVASFQVINGAWSKTRDAFDAVHALRSAQAAHVARQLSEGRCVEEELDADLVPVAGWTAALEFLRDAWVLGSSSKVVPVARAIDLDAVAKAAGDSDG